MIVTGCSTDAVDAEDAEPDAVGSEASEPAPTDAAIAAPPHTAAQEPAQFVPDQLIVLFKPDRKVETHEQDIEDARGTIVHRMVHRRLYLVQFLQGADLDAAEAQLLATGDVVLAIRNYIGHDSSPDPNDPAYPAQWTHDPIQLHSAWHRDSGSTSVKVAVVDGGIDFGHPDFAGHLWQNDLECCGESPCPVPCDLTQACPTGEQITGGCPGACDVDDDGDGLADFLDPNVQQIWTNGIDDDHDGFVDEQGPFGLPCQVLASLPGGAPADEDCDGASDDDDENGYLDDCKGYDFRGEQSPFDQDNEPQYFTADHGLAVSSILASVPNNAIGMAGMHENVQIVTVLRNLELYRILEAYAYSSDLGVDIINASHTIQCLDPNVCDGETSVQKITELLRVVLGRQVLFVNAPRNEPPDDYDAFPPGEWEFPVHAEIPNMLTVARSNENDGYSQGPFGASTIDLAAPGEEQPVMAFPSTTGEVCSGQTLPDGYGCSSGTSLAAPHIAGAGALIVSRFEQGIADPFSGNPLRIRDTILDNVDVLPAFQGIVVSDGRLNVCKALGKCQGAGPPPVKRFVERTREQMPTAFMDVSTYDVDLFDADGDGDLDLLTIMCSHHGLLNQPLLYINDGTGRFVNETADRLPAGTRSQCAADTIDVNGDGDLDIVTAGFGSWPGLEAERQNRIYLNDGTGVFTDGTAQLFPSDSLMSRDIDGCDLDGDLDLDLVITGIGEVSVYINAGNGFYTDETAAWVPAINPAPNIHNSACADLTGDGLPDVFITSDHTQNRLLVNTGTTLVDETVARGIPDSTNDYTHDVEVADVTGNGHPDLVLGLRDGGGQRILINNGSGVYSDQTAQRLPSTSDTTSEVDAADVDGDCDIDLLVLNGNPNVDLGAAGQNRLYLNNGAGFFTDASEAEGISSGAVDISTDASFGDVDGDGDVDVVVGNWGAPSYLLINTGGPGGGC